MNTKEAIKELEDIRQYCYMFGSEKEVYDFINDQGVKVSLRGAYGRNKGEIWAVKGEVRMRVGTLYENTYYCMCAVIELPYFEQLKLKL